MVGIILLILLVISSKKVLFVGFFKVFNSVLVVVFVMVLVWGINNILLFFICVVFDSLLMFL